MLYTQIEIERELSDAVPHGIREDIARKAHLYPSVFYGWMNPDDERKSPQYSTLLVQSVLDNCYPEAGEKHWQSLCRLREAGKPVSGTSCEGNLVGTLLTGIRRSASLIDEIGKAIEDGQVDEKEAYRLLSLLKEVKDHADRASDDLKLHLTAIAERKGPRAA